MAQRKGNAVEENIRDFLDLNTWEETKGFSSFFYVICPHCENRFPAHVLRGLGLYYCKPCGGAFNVTTSIITGIKTYHTSAVNPEKGESRG